MEANCPANWQTPTNHMHRWVCGIFFFSPDLGSQAQKRKVIPVCLLSRAQEWCQLFSR